MSAPFGLDYQTYRELLDEQDTMAANGQLDTVKYTELRQRMRALYARLNQQERWTLDNIEMEFAEIRERVGRELREDARRHREWLASGGEDDRTAKVSVVKPEPVVS